MSMNDPFHVSPGSNLAIRNESEADQEERETTALTRKVRLRAVKLATKVLDTCEEALDEKVTTESGARVYVNSLKDRLAACKVIIETAGINKVAPPVIYLDQRTSDAVNDEEAQMLFELGIGDAPSGRRPEQVVDAQLAPQFEAQEERNETPAFKIVVPEREKNEESPEDLPEWCR